MPYSLSDKWLWDGWHVHDGKTWHGYFLEAPNSLEDPEQRHWNVSYHHATSDDLVNWRGLGTCFRPAPSPAWDDMTVWTGSVIRGEDDLWHLFYTGGSKAEDGLKQRIGHAVSDDLHDWRRVGSGLILDVAPPYEELDLARWHDRAMRDPWVMKDPAGGGYLLYFTGRDARAADPMAAGCIGFATSPDLYEWRLEEPVFTGAAGQLEVPQVFEKDGIWRCLFCTAANHWSEDAKAFLGEASWGGHYLIADDPRGPWRLAPGPILDGGAFPKRYAQRVVERDGALDLMGFYWFGEQDGPFVGEIADPERLEASSDGRLALAADRREKGG